MLTDWNVFDIAALSNVTSFNFGELRLQLWLEYTSISLTIWMKSASQLYSHNIVTSDF